LHTKITVATYKYIKRYLNISHNINISYTISVSDWKKTSKRENLCTIFYDLCV